MAKAGGFLGLLTLGAVYGWTYLWPFPQADELRPAKAIICLAAGLKPDGSLSPLTEQRTRSCVRLYHAGLAPVLAFTGGNSTHDAPPAGTQMAGLARSLGVPANAIVVEDRAESTLQNALFTLPLLDSPRGIILVTDSFHLPRAALSFTWAGARELQLSPASGEAATLMPRQFHLLKEAVKIWVNAARVPVYSLAGLFGAPPEARHWILR